MCFVPDNTAWMLLKTSVFPFSPLHQQPPAVELARAQDMYVQ